MTTHHLLLVLFSFTCSCSFGITFHIRPQALVYAGLGGAITRIALLLAQSCLTNRFLYTLIAAMVGALYAEVLAHWKHTPITKFLYPSFVPIIPGDLLYNTVVCFVVGSFVEGSAYMVEMTQALLGLALGGMLVPMIVHSGPYWQHLKEYKVKQGLKKAMKTAASITKH